MYMIATEMEEAISVHSCKGLGSVYHHPKVDLNRIGHVMSSEGQED